MRNQAVRQSDSESSREKLIASAERLFADRGFDGVSVRDIANAAGVNSALVGYYFRGKEGLLSEVYTRHCEPMKRERARLLEEFSKAAKGPTLEQVIEAFIRPALEVTTDKNGRTDFTRKYRVPRLHRRLPKLASAYSGLHVFVPLAWTAPGAVWVA
jgi:AcrR family transcriptional regulator